jgi:hypothetical protein
MSKRKRAWFMVGIALILLLAIAIPRLQSRHFEVQGDDP